MAREDDEPPTASGAGWSRCCWTRSGIEELRSYIDELKARDRPGRGGYRPQEQPPQRGRRFFKRPMKASGDRSTGRTAEQREPLAATA